MVDTSSTTYGGSEIWVEVGTYKECFDGYVKIFEFSLEECKESSLVCIPLGEKYDQIEGVCKKYKDLRTISKDDL